MFYFEFSLLKGNSTNQMALNRLIETKWFMLEFENNYIRMDLIHLSQLNDIELTQMDFSWLASY